MKQLIVIVIGFVLLFLVSALLDMQWVSKNFLRVGTVVLLYLAIVFFAYRAYNAVASGNNSKN